MAKSDALPISAVNVLMLLSPRRESGSLALTDAKLRIVPDVVGAVITRVTVADDPLVKEPIVHTTGALPAQVPGFPEAEVRVAPAGMESLITTPVALDGPLL